MTEAYTSLDNEIRFYGTADRNGSQIPFNFELISYTNVNSTAADYKKHIDDWLNKVPKGKVANWVVRIDNEINETEHLLVAFISLT